MHIYSALLDYVESGETFAPIDIYPVDRKTGKKFLCLIMPGNGGVEVKVEDEYQGRVDQNPDARMNNSRFDNVSEHNESCVSGFSNLSSEFSNVSLVA